jgi:signal transduction histidine kinase
MASTTERIDASPPIPAATTSRTRARIGGLLRWGRLPAVGSLSAVDVLWSAFVVAMFVTMLAIPGQQTIPYHLIYVSFALIYGYRLWSPGTTVAVLFAIGVVSGVLFVRVYYEGEISWDELSEIPLMSLIVAGTAWHALRSASAQRRVEELAALESSRLDRQRAFLRDTAHAIRTPVTIARGNIELLQLGSDDPQLKEDTAQVLHQLDRLHEMARRLLVIEALQTAELFDAERIDVGALVADAGRRWSSAAWRTWLLPEPISVEATVDRLRLEESIDAMVENALRFTSVGGTIRISCRADVDYITIEVADDGPGIPAADWRHVFERFFQRHPVGEEPGTGLGLALVAAVSTAFGGDAWAGVAPEGGALVGMRIRRR